MNLYSVTDMPRFENVRDFYDYLEWWWCPIWAKDEATAIAFAAEICPHDEPELRAKLTCVPAEKWITGTKTREERRDVVMREAGYRSESDEQCVGCERYSLDHAEWSVCEECELCRECAAEESDHDCEVCRLGEVVG